MTLVLAVHSRDWIWMLADRKLWYGEDDPRNRDDGVKVACLETTDGVALLGYAGLGATSKGMEPSEWMAATLNGRSGLTLEQSLGFLADVANRELPRHLATLKTDEPVTGHFIVVPAFVKGVGARQYAIGIELDRTSGQRKHHFISMQRSLDPASPSRDLACSGTGGAYLKASAHEWQRSLLNLMRAHDEGNISTLAVADQLAALNYEASQKVPKGTVGPNCVVIWRSRPEPEVRNRLPGGGGQFYTGTDRDSSNPGVPTVMNGYPVSGIGGVIMDLMQERIAAGDIESGLDAAEINRRVGKLPATPDDKLR